jgi:hypothetical protein
LISVATVGAPVSDMRAKLGNEVAMKAFRAGTLPFPDGTIIARPAWKQTTSEENNRAIGPLAEKQLGPEAAQKLLSQSFVAGPALNVQFMVKDSKKYASTTSLHREAELLGQTVVVIGGSAGIGLETARRARAEGANVILTGRDPERLQRAAQELGASTTAAFDATNPAEFEQFFRDLRSRLTTRWSRLVRHTMNA